MKIICLVIMIIVFSSVSLFTDEISGQFKEDPGYFSSGDNTYHQESQANKLTLIRNVISRLEELEEEHINKLSKKQRSKASEILNEVYTMLSFLPTDIDLPFEEAASLRSALEATEIDLNDHNRIKQPPNSIEDLPPMELQRLEEVAKLVRVPMSNDDYQNLITSVQNERFWEDQIRIIRLSVRNSFFTVEQIINIVGVFYFFEDQQEVLRVMYPRVTDPQNAYQIPNAFNFYSDRYAIERIISNN